MASRDRTCWKRVERSFPDGVSGRFSDGGKAAKAFALELENAVTVYDVRTRIGGRVVTRTFKRRKDADAYANTVEADKLRGVARDPRASRITLAEYARKWMERRLTYVQLRGQSTATSRPPHPPTLGQHDLCRLSPSSVRGWYMAYAADMWLPRTTLTGCSGRFSIRPSPMR